MDGLILHCGAQRVSRDELKLVTTPGPSKTWSPVSHFKVASLIVQQAMDNGFEIAAESYGLTANGGRMFGLLKFNHSKHRDFTRCLGFRNSHDKCFALGLTVGVNVYICDNLCFGGEQTLHRRHTKNIDVEAMIPRAFNNLHEQYIMLEENVERLKAQHISMDDARIITCKAAEMRAIRPADVVNVLKIFEQPLHKEFAEKNAWSLYNCLNEQPKRYSAAKADNCYRCLSRLFAMGKVIA